MIIINIIFICEFATYDLYFSHHFTFIGTRWKCRIRYWVVASYRKNSYYLVYKFMYVCLFIVIWLYTIGILRLITTNKPSISFIRTWCPFLVFFFVLFRLWLKKRCSILSLSPSRFFPSTNYFLKIQKCWKIGSLMFKKDIKNQNTN